jgi:hypothetical protein
MRSFKEVYYYILVPLSCLEGISVLKTKAKIEKLNFVM